MDSLLQLDFLQTQPAMLRPIGSDSSGTSSLERPENDYECADLGLLTKPQTPE
jgi:hypothetical protein